ncbi:MAG TPA: hypothetical protein EYP21_07370, partial [Syntrophaceae bacterium]|nr:hypothetical protein [Syntrophaceae bacterium]
LRSIATSIEPEEAGYLAYARALAYWNRTHLYCGRCGSLTESKKNGHERHCTSKSCECIHFPRTDPAVIMLVTHPSEDKCLLGLFYIETAPLQVTLSCWLWDWIL